MLLPKPWPEYTALVGSDASASGSLTHDQDEWMALAAPHLDSPATRSGDDELNPPVEFGRYQLMRRLGHGGFATVFLALEASAAGKPREVVVKRLHEHLALDERSREAFLDEARLAIGLNHPNIVTALDFGSIEGRPFLAMEYLIGADLDRVLERLRTQNQRLKPELAMEIAANMLEGLAYLHERRDPSGRPAPIVHRDVSPHNAFVTDRGVLKLLDFGIAKARVRAVETTTGVVKGKFAYMSPEQANGEPVEPSADVWSMGVVLWEMLAGQRLFEASSTFSTLASAMLGPIPRLDKIADVPESVALVVEKALERAPSARYQNARELAVALRNATPYAPSDSAQVASLVQGLFGDALTRAREDSVRRVVKATQLGTSRRGTLWPWALAGSVGALAFAIFALRPDVHEPGKGAEISTSPARSLEPPPTALPSAPPQAEAPRVAPEPVAPEPVETPAPAAPSTSEHAAGKSPRKASAPAGTGHLTLVTEPWSQVSLEGKQLGTTPLVNLALPAGRHELMLKNPSTGEQKTLMIDIAPGQTLQRRVVLGTGEKNERQ
jgi:serine/threonine protein kinase